MRLAVVISDNLKALFTRCNFYCSLQRNDGKSIVEQAAEFNKN